MAWLFGDSFDHYATADLTQKYQVVGSGGDGVRITPGSGIDGTSGAEFWNGNGWLARGVAQGTVAIVGFAFRTTMMGQAAVHCLHDAISNRANVSYVVNSDGSISAWRQYFNSPPMFSGGNPVSYAAQLIGSTAAGLILANVQHHLQFKTTIHPTAGTVEIKIDGVTRLALTGQNTQNFDVSGLSYVPSGNPWYTLIYVGGFLYNAVSKSTFIDDVWMCNDDAGPADGCTDFLGSLTAEACRPNGVGVSSAFTPTAGANYTNVDDSTPDGDTTVVSAGSVGVKDTYAHTPLTRIGSGIKCVQQVTSARKSTGASRAICHVLRSAGADYDNSDIYLGSTYGMQISAQPLDPATGVAWVDPAAVDATEIGQKVTV